MRIRAIVLATTFALVGNAAAAGGMFETLKSSEAIMLTEQQMDTIRGGTGNLVINIRADGGETLRASFEKYTSGAHVNVGIVVIVVPTFPTGPQIIQEIVPPSPFPR